MYGKRSTDSPYKGCHRGCRYRIIRYYLLASGSRTTGGGRTDRDRSACRRRTLLLRLLSVFLQRVATRASAAENLPLRGKFQRHVVNRDNPRDFSSWRNIEFVRIAIRIRGRVQSPESDLNRYVTVHTWSTRIRWWSSIEVHEDRTH